jgi:hypothetical protein
LGIIGRTGLPAAMLLPECIVWAQLQVLQHLSFKCCSITHAACWHPVQLTALVALLHRVVDTWLTLLSMMRQYETTNRLHAALLWLVFISYAMEIVMGSSLPHV